MNKPQARKASAVISSISIVLGVFLLALAGLCILGLASTGWNWALAGAALTALCLAADLLQAGIQGNLPAVALLYMYLL